MAQFRAASREGSFSANQLVVPDEVQKIKQEGNRVISGMNAHQDALNKQRGMFLDAQRTAQDIQRRGAEAAFKVDQAALDAEAKRSAELWKLQLAQQEAKDRYKVDTFGALADFSKTAFDITSNIVKANKENQQRAVNQIIFKNGFTFDDAITAASVDASISEAEWMRTQTVKDMITSGKSADFARVMYSEMIKGGGYRNYIHNKDILSRLGRQNASDILLIAGNRDIPIEERRKQIATLEMQQRGALTVNDQIPDSKILELSGYNSSIKSALNKSEEVLTGATLQQLEESTRIDQSVNIHNAVNPGGDVFDPEAGFKIIQSDLRPEAIDDFIKQLVTGNNLSTEQIAAIKEARFEKNGKMITLQEGGYSTALTMLNQEYDRAKRDSIEATSLREEAEKLEVQQFMMERAEAAMADGKYTRQELDADIVAADKRFGTNRDRSKDEELSNETVAAQLRPIIERDLERRALDGSLSRRYMMEQRIPLDLQNKYSQFADRNDQIKASPEYKDIDKNIRARVKGAMAGVKEFETLVEGKFQSDEAQWFLSEQTKKYRKVYFDAMVAGANQSELNSILDQAAYETAEYLKSDENFEPGVGIASYNKYMTESAKEQLKTQQKITSLERFFANAWKRENPKELIKAVGEAPLVEAAEELRMTGSSVLIEHIGSKLRKTPIEVINELAEVNENIPPIVVPENYQQMLDNFTPASRFNFTSDLATNEARQREIQRQLQQTAPMPTREAYQKQASSNPVQSRWESLAQQAGFSPEEAVIMGQIVMAESGGDAQNDTVKSGLDPNKTNEYSIGGPQINVAVHQDKLKARGFTEEDMRDPLKAMIIAKDVYDQQGFDAWTTYQKGLHLNFNQASGGPRSHTGALTYRDNKQAYRSAGKAFKDAGFRVGEHSDFDKVDPVHSKNSYHYHDEAFDITDWTGGDAPGAREASIAKTGRLQRLIESLGLFYEVIGPLSNDPDHASHLHLGGLKRPMTAEDIKRIKSLK